MKSISCLLIVALLLISNRLVLAQARAYDADMLVKNGTSLEKIAISIAPENGVLKINGIKTTGFVRSFAASDLKSVDYSYSDKPMYKEAVITTLAFGWSLGLPFFFTKTKRHWLALSTDREAVLFELQKENYRQLLLAMNANGIEVEDLGDRDRKVAPLPKPSSDPSFVEGESCGNDIF